MPQLLSIIKITIKGIIRDRVFQGIMALSTLFLGIPSAASLSMRQVTELSVTLSLSLISFILLLLSVFLGATVFWKDLERRYTVTVLSLPLSRGTYLLGRFLGLSLFLGLTSIILASAACLAIKAASGIYPPDRPLVWSYLLVSIMFMTLEYVLLVGVALALSTVSTGFFLPIFGTISVYLAGSFSQQAYEYVTNPNVAGTLPPVSRYLATVVYYLLPNLSGFDLKVNAIYAIAPNPAGLMLTIVYFCAYMAILLGCAILLFNRRELA